MIWTFTPNPALDITWQAPDQTRGQVHRITEYSQRPGGKGLNVSRVLEQLGVPNHATGFLGGTTGQAIASLMEEMTTQVTTHWVDVPVQTRRSIAMIDGEATVKELSVTGGHVWLLPHNADYSPIPGDGATILGKVVTVIRSL